MRQPYRRSRRRARPRRSASMSFLQVAFPAALLGTFVGLAYNMADSGVGPAAQATTSDAGAIACRPTVVDGDTLRCGGTRIRLQGIDAPEMPGHCRRSEAHTSELQSPMRLSHAVFFLKNKKSNH